MKKFFGEFKKFISRGSVIDMAVGMVVGSAFTAIVNSLVSDIITPAISLITGNISFADLKYVVIPAEVVDEVVVKPEVAITYGNLIQAIINFLLIAFCLFCVIRAINKVKERAEKADKEAAAAEAAAKAEADRIAAEKAAEEAAAKAALPTKEEALLMEIRDLLAKK